jgi:hypothetical protein
MGAPDFLLRFPQKVDVDPGAVSERVLRAPERGERRPFVVRSPAAPVAFVLHGEAEGLRRPSIGFLRRLDVEVVVDGHRRVVRALIEAAMEHGMASGVEDPDLAADPPDQVCRVRNHRRHVRLPLGIRGDARDLHEILERLLEASALRLRVIRKRLLRESLVDRCGHERSCSPGFRFRPAIRRRQHTTLPTRCWETPRPCGPFAPEGTACSRARRG